MKELKVKLSDVNKSKRRVNKFVKEPYLNLVSARKRNDEDRYLIELRKFLNGYRTMLMLVKEDLYFSETFIKDNIQSKENVNMYNTMIENLLLKENSLSLIVKKIDTMLSDHASNNKLLKESFYETEKVKSLVSELVSLNAEASIMKEGIKSRGLNFLLDLL